MLKYVAAMISIFIFMLVMPTVICSADNDSSMDFGVIKTLPDGTDVSSSGAIVTLSVADGLFWIESRDRSCGITVWNPGGGRVPIGSVVDVSGTIQTGVQAERYINADSVNYGGNIDIAPLGMNVRSLGGGPFGLQVGATGAAGLNNVGLLVRIWGELYYSLDDTYIIDGEDWRNWAGIMIPWRSSAVIDPDWTSVQITGISRVWQYEPNGRVYRKLFVRSAKDISGSPEPIWDFQFAPDFTGDSAEIVRTGTAVYTTDSGLDDVRRLRMTSNQQNQYGTAMYGTKVPTLNGYVTKFAFQISEPFNEYANALSFVMQKIGSTSPAYDTAGSVAVSISTYQAMKLNVHENGFGALKASVDLNALGVDVKDERTHLMEIICRPDWGTITVRIDGVYAVTDCPVNFSTAIDVDGKSWVGFGGICGAAAANHDIVYWKFRSLTPLPPSEQLTYVDLVDKLLDMESLSGLPKAGEKCAPWASYDRTSYYDAGANSYMNWAANNDATGIIRKEIIDGREQDVLAEMTGPGCIWRIFSAQPDYGHVRIYLDGNLVPVIDLPFWNYFDSSSLPFKDYPNLTYHSALGTNSYLPISYQHSCKITADPWQSPPSKNGWGLYYHFTYSTFPQGTVVKTFKPDFTTEERAALARVDNFFASQLGENAAGTRAGETEYIRNLIVDSGATAQVANIAGPRAITALKVKLHSSFTGSVEDVMRQVVLKISWDGETKPSVLVPIGDFFGTAPGINHYKSLPMGMTQDGFYSYWYMPFATNAKIELVNEGLDSFPVEFKIKHAPLARRIEDLGRFHAKWHRNTNDLLNAGRGLDWSMLKTSGRGRYCGVALHVWNAPGGWWGEGDEKFFVDGEKFPSTFGTGSEDYFGYAWCWPEIFARSFHSQPKASTGNYGHTSNNRWHITDNVPFMASFDGSIEKYFWDDNLTRYACTVYWYLAPGGDDHYGLVPASERIGYYTGVPAPY